MIINKMGLGNTNMSLYQEVVMKKESNVYMILMIIFWSMVLLMRTIPFLFSDYFYTLFLRLIGNIFIIPSVAFTILFFVHRKKERKARSIK